MGSLNLLIGQKVVQEMSSGIPDKDELSEWIESKQKNPFVIPETNDLLVARENIKKLALQKRREQRNEPVHNKHTYSTRLSHITAQTGRIVLGDNEKPKLSKEASQIEAQKRDEEWALQQENKHPFGKEDIFDYISGIREMFLVKYSIEAKRDKMRKLERVAHAEEQKLVDAKKKLENDAIEFDLFLKENDRSSVEAINHAEAQTKKKLDAIAEIRRRMKVTRAVQTELAKQEERMRELTRYKNFVDALTPENQRHRSDEIYFDNPVELLKLFHELEDQNLSLIQHSQDMEESFEELKNHAKYTRDRLNREVEFLADQIKIIEGGITREEEKGEDYKFKCHMFSFGDYNQDDQDRILTEFGSKVESVYTNIIGDNDANINTLQMLTSIENALGLVLDLQENLPEDQIAEYEKKFEKGRRVQLRERKIREQEALAKERVKRALKRSQAAPRQKIGRRLIQRSEPPKIQTKTYRKNKEQVTMEQQEHRYFFEY